MLDLKVCKDQNQVKNLAVDLTVGTLAVPVKRSRGRPSKLILVEVTSYFLQYYNKCILHLT